MATRESSLVWKPIKKELDRLVFHYLRIENKTCPGVPDLNIRSLRLNQDIWIELKYIKEEPKNVNNKLRIGLRNEQYLWLCRAQNYGRNVLLVARIGERWMTWENQGAFLMALNSTRYSDLLQLAKIYNSPFEMIDAHF